MTYWMELEGVMFLKFFVRLSHLSSNGNHVLYDVHLGAMYLFLPPLSAECLQYKHRTFIVYLNRVPVRPAISSRGCKEMAATLY